MIWATLYHTIYMEQDVMFTILYVLNNLLITSIVSTLSTNKTIIIIVYSCLLRPCKITLMASSCFNTSIYMCPYDNSLQIGYNIANFGTVKQIDYILAAIIIE